MWDKWRNSKEYKEITSICGNVIQREKGTVKNWKKYYEGI